MAGRPAKTPAPSFGSRLAALRKTRGLTQPQLAEKLEISAEMLAYYERRAKNPSAEFIKKAAMTLQVSVDELLGHEAPNKKKTGPPSQLEQRILAIKNLPRHRQKVLIEILDTFLRDAQHA
jgi:transcriptional regulator with XRE-family HTH domain